MSDLRNITLTVDGLSLEQLRAIYQDNVTLCIDAALKKAVEKSARVIADAMAAGKVVYGVKIGRASCRERV